jgi:hypothetical protein
MGLPLRPSLHRRTLQSLDGRLSRGDERVADAWRVHSLGVPEPASGAQAGVGAGRIATSVPATAAMRIGKLSPLIMSAISSMPSEHRSSVACGSIRESNQIQFGFRRRRAEREKLTGPTLCAVTGATVVEQVGLAGANVIHRTKSGFHPIQFKSPAPHHSMHRLHQLTGLRAPCVVDHRRRG